MAVIELGLSTRLEVNLLVLIVIGYARPPWQQSSLFEAQYYEDHSYMFSCLVPQYYGQPSYLPPAHPTAPPPQPAEKSKEDLTKGDPKVDLKVRFGDHH